MTVKAYLSQVKSIKMQLVSMTHQIETLEDTLSDASPKLSQTPRGPSPDVHRMEKLIAAKVDLERKIAEGERKLVEITQAINSLPDALCVAILTRRYVDDMCWREIIGSLHISRSHLHRLHCKALSLIDTMRLNETR
jgi:DNA-directed RNA polymerase specialized sigma subunit